MSQVVNAAAPAVPPMLLSGLEPLVIGEGSLFVNIGERTNVTGSKAFARMILNGQYEEALVVAQQDLADQPAHLAGALHPVIALAVFVHLVKRLPAVLRNYSIKLFFKL